MSELQVRANRLRYVNGLSLKEIAEIMNQPISAVNFWLYPTKAEFNNAYRAYGKKS